MILSLKVTTGRSEKVFEAIEAAARMLEEKLDDIPDIALILGSGLGPITESFDDQVEIPYSQIPHFPRSTVEGHSGKLVVGGFGGRTVIAMSGRFHVYEGYSARQVVFPIYVFKRLGVKGLIITNAAGTLNPSIKPGSIVFVKDFFNLAFRNPLRGPNDERIGPRFPDMSSPVDFQWWSRTREALEAKGLKVEEGVYCWVTGPSYETPAEIRAMKRLGADLVGMSTVPEIIAANHAGLKLLVFSLATNYASGMSEGKLSQEEVIEMGRRMRPRFSRVLSIAVKTF
ncbi:MAG TPA: purine-nucleoside phosphorylase [Thermotogae bacterium]|nr:purine-nucleoside phosphorylase [Thermotogota bacterium]